MEQEEDHDEIVGWKRTGEEKGHRGVKRGETTVLVALDTSNHTNKKTATERMQERGKTAVDTKTVYQTDAQIEWTMTEGCKKINIRAALVSILEKFERSTPGLIS
eukprot:2143105-Ditylum_brightwellii.AAC.1